MLYETATSSFRQGQRAFDSVLGKLSSCRDQYKAKMDGIIGIFKSELDSVAEARNRFSGAYKGYTQAGEELKSAAGRSAPNVGELKSAFVEAQRNAVEVHNALTELTVQTALKLESALSQFEDTEEWRSNHLKDLLIEVANWIEGFAHSIDESQIPIRQLQRLAPEVSAIADVFASAGSLPDADAGTAADNFQIIPIDPLALQFIEASAIFKEEQKQGMPLHRVIKTTKAHADYIDVEQGAVICQLEDKGNVIMALTINGSRGLVEKASLVPFNGYSAEPGRPK
jgi:hypothetical protein